MFCLLLFLCIDAATVTSPGTTSTRLTAWAFSPIDYWVVSSRGLLTLAARLVFSMLCCMLCLLLGSGIGLVSLTTFLIPQRLGWTWLIVNSPCYPTSFGLLAVLQPLPSNSFRVGWLSPSSRLLSVHGLHCNGPSSCS